MAMEPKKSPRSSGSLIERAATVYDFQAVMRERLVVAPPVPEPEPRHPRESADTAYPSPAPKQRDSRFRGNDVLGRVGTIDREELREAGFILPDAPVSALAEEFRIVKRQLLIGAMGGDIENGRMILVCSAQPNEGKTFCAVNLALSLANERDTEVLLIDADFAKPEILSTLGLEAGPGIMDAIADPSVDVESCIIRTDIAGLSVLPAGQLANEATELLASDHARTVLDQLAAKPSRILIFDSAPALAASSASVLAFHAGQALMVVRADRTSEAELREAVGLLGGCGHIRPLLNGVEFAANGRRFGSYYGYGV
jgi:exopolysaccharide/PEP-CTERM locus tyrosine autokinase